MAAQLVNAVICGVEVKGLLVMESKFDGFDPHAKRRFKAGDQIAYIHKDRLTKAQTDAIFGDGKVYNLAIRWPMTTEHEDKPVAPKPQPVKQTAKVSFEPSEYQKSILETVLNSQDHILIEALAGSGKTSTLVWLLQQLFALGLSKGKTIIYLAFNKSIQEELASKLQGTGIPALTTHAFGFGLLKKRFGSTLTLKKNKPSELFQMLICDDNDWRYSKEAFKTARKTDAYKLNGAVKELVGYCKNWGVFPEDRTFTQEQRNTIAQFIESYEVEFDRMLFEENEVIDYVCRILLSSIPAPGENISEIDYDDMLFLPICLNLPIPKYDIVLIDEAQDLNGVQIMLLEKLSKN